MSSPVSAVSARLPTPSIFTRTFMLGIVGSLSMYLTSWENADRVRDSYLDKHRDVGETFDFIIVGGGTAGLYLANKLSENYKTLLLEAGGEPHPFTTIPLLSNYLLNYAELDWRHVTMPQKQAFRGSIQTRASISQGRGLGGSSNIDYMMYLRGHPLDYDNWANITGDSSWAYNEMEKHFKSLEHYTGPWTPGNHGDSGMLTIQQPSFTGLGEQFCRAAQQNGYKQTDLNTKFSEGCDVCTYTTKKGYRNSAYNAFLKKIKDRWNLVVKKYAHVNKVLVRGSDNSAYGVEYDRHGKSHIAYAKKEIIMTAGAIQTPKILQLSGIGPKADLAAIGIPVIADLPVGKNLQDHLSVFLGPFFVDRGKSIDVDRDISTGSVLSLARNSGPLTTTGFQAAAVISSGLEKLHGSRNWPDLQLTMYGISHHKTADEDFSHAYQLKKEMLTEYLEHSKGHDSFAIVVSGGRPKSSGTVKLLNRNPYAPLIINPNYFDKIYDVVVMVDGLKKATRLVENSTALFRDLNARFTLQVLPGCEKFRFRSDAYFECYVRTMSVSLGNVAGTVPLGTVLNSKLEVKGVKGLRVMDASVMPSIVSTSTSAAVMVIAEKGANLILKKWEGKGSEVGGPGILKGSNLVFDKIMKESASFKLGLDSSKALLNTLKSVATTVSSVVTKTEPSLAEMADQFNLGELEQLTKSVGTLAAILGQPLPSVPADLYTGSFKLGNDSKTPTAPSPVFKGKGTAHLKSQLGGLYQSLFADDSDTDASITSEVKVSPENKGKGSKVSGLNSLLKPPKDKDPIKIIQDMIAGKMKELEQIQNITAITSMKMSTSVKSDLQNFTTLDDIFGMADEVQDELEDYEDLDFLTTELPNNTRTNNTRSIDKIAKTTTSTTRRPSTTKRTTKPPLIDYTYYEVRPDQKSKSTTPAPLIKEVKPTSPPRPIYPKPNEPTITYSVIPASRPPPPSPPPPSIPPPVAVPSPAQKLQTLRALEQIQHETLAKIKSKLQQHRPLPYNQPTVFTPSYPTQPGPPSLDILPPPLRGRYPPPPFHQQGAPPPHPHPGLGHPLPPPLPPRMPHQFSPLLRPYPPTPSPNHDPSDLKYAVSSIMNAKYTHPTVNPFIGVLEYLTKSARPEVEASSVLKALQLRANVDKLLHVPFALPPRPIPITHRPTPPPPTYPTAPPPPPTTTEDGGIFAPIKDVFQPITNLMKAPLKLLPTDSISNIMTAPLKLLPNPFKQETSTASSITDEIFSGLFSQRAGPLHQERSEPPKPQIRPYPAPPLRSRYNPLSAVMPRFFVNQQQPKPSADMSQDMFLKALENITTGLPKPFVLEPPKAFTPTAAAAVVISSGKEDEKHKKLLGESISDILGHLKNHHFANVASSSAPLVLEFVEAVESSTSRSDSGTKANSANEILNIDFSSAAGPPVTPRVKFNPPIEFHKSVWAKEPSVPTKSLHFKIRIVKE